MTTTPSALELCAPLQRPQRVQFGPGAVRHIPRWLQELRCERVLLVIDRPAYERSGAEAALTAELARLHVASFHDFELNPKIEDIERGIELFRQFGPQALVAIGGGSAIDVAKIIGACGREPAACQEYVAGRLQLSQAGPPLIAVPTTAGTGSEATHFAVAYMAGQKYSLAHAYLLPAFAVLDPELTYSLPAAVTAASGLDALCQAIESYWSVGATDASLPLAAAAITLAAQHLPEATLHPTPAARHEMLLAAHLAGCAIDISKTTAPHAVSYALTTHYKVPHGVAVALTLAPFLQFNGQVDSASCLDPRGPEHVRNRIARVVSLLGCETPAAATARWRDLLEQIGCPTQLRAVGIPPQALAHLAAQVNVERMANNPRRLAGDELLQLLQAIY